MRLNLSPIHGIGPEAEVPAPIEDATGPKGPCARISLLGALLLLLQAGPPALAQPAVLVKDIATAPSSTFGISPASLVAAGSTVYFAAGGEGTGFELWKSNGTEAGTVLVKDIRTGLEGSAINYLTIVGGTLFFQADDGVNGAELWKSNGTEAGTVMVRDIFPGPDGSYPSGLTNLGGTLYFTANDGPNGSELWQSDGTPAGTVLVKDICSGPGCGSNPTNLTVAGGTLYFAANDGTNGTELWKSDGTDAGTFLVKDIWQGGNGSGPSNLINMGGTLFFVADDGASGRELWKSNGTAAGTVMVKDIWPGGGGSSPNNMTVVGGILFFSATDGSSARELWKSDGTSEGTVLVKDVYPGGYSSVPAWLTAMGGVLYFSAKDGVHGVELWRSDGTDIGTYLVKDICTGPADSIVSFLAVSNGKLFFQANDCTSGPELWESDGTSDGTVLVKDIWPGGSGSYPINMTDVEGTLFFRGIRGGSGPELWKSDGTEGGTVIVKDFTSISSFPSFFIDLGNTLYFSADDGVAGRELWRSDGTTGGTSIVMDIWPGGDASNPSGLTKIGSTFFFSAWSPTSGWELWKSDGTEGGTVLVKDICPGGGCGSGPQLLTEVNGVLFFVANDGTNGQELWKSNGSDAGTVLVKDICPGSGSSSIQNLVNVNGTLFFTASDGVNGIELWKSDGSPAGTMLVKDICAGGCNSNPSYLTAVGGTLYFAANDPVNGNGLWKSNGTEAGTVLVSNLVRNLSSLVNVNGVLFFSGNWGGQELYKSDGTPSGTVLVKDINPTGSSMPSNLVNVNGTLFFRANDGARGVELWKSDGTAAGTVLVKDVNPGAGSSLPRLLTAVGSTLFFVANDGTSGEELWRSDGTAAGTFRVQDIAPGAASSAIASIAVSGAHLFFSADDGVHGQELWALGQTDLSVTKTASPDPALQGNTVTYTVTVTNAGSIPATGVRLTDWLPTGVTFASSTPSSPTCTLATGVVTCDLGTILPAANSIVTIQATVNVGFVGTLANTARVVSNEADSNPANDAATAAVTVSGPSPALNLWAAATSTTAVDLKWTDPQSSETGFRLERSETGTSWTLVFSVGPNVTTYTDTGRTPGTLYYYRVVSVQSGVGEAPPSNVASARTFPATAAKVCASQVSPMHKWARFASVAWNGTGWGAVWMDRRDGKDEEVYFQLLDAATGAPQGVPVNVSNDDMMSRYPTVRWNGSRFGVVWYDNMRGPSGNIPAGGTSFALLDAAGNVVRSRVRVDDSGMVPGYLGSNLETALAWNGSEWGLVLSLDVGGVDDMIFYRLSAEGDRIGNPVRLTTTPENEIDMSIAWSGTSYGLSWIRQSGNTSQVLFQRMQTDGTLLGSPTLLWENTGGQGVVATSTVWDGAGWAVAFGDVELAPGNPEVVYIRRVTPDGTTNGAAVRVSPALDPDFPPEDAVPVYDEVPYLLVKPGGGGYVVFTGSYLNTNYIYEIGRYETDAAGNRIGTRTIVSDNDGRHSYYAGAASDGARILAVYNDSRLGTLEASAVLVNASGPPVSGPLDLTSGHGPGNNWGVTTSGGQLVLPVGDGFAALWLEPVTFNTNLVWAKIFDGSGNLSATRWPLSTRPARGRIGGVGVGDTFALAWKDPSNNVVFARYDALGNPLTAEVVVMAGANGRLQVGIAFSGEAYGLVWFQGLNLLFQRVAPDGTPVGGRTTVPLANAPQGVAQQIVWTGSGWAIVYPRGPGLEYVFIDPSGIATVGPVTLTATSTPGNPFTLAWSGQQLGLAWVDLGPPTSGLHVYYTVLDLNGVKAFPPALVAGTVYGEGNPSLYWDQDRFRLVHTYDYGGILREIAIQPNGTVLPGERMLSNRGGANLVAWNGTTLGVLWLQLQELYFETTACLADVTRPTCPAASVSVNAQTATLTWTAATDPESGIYRYNVYRDGFQLAELRPTTMSFVDGGFPPGVTHVYEVRGQNGAYLESTGCSSVPPSADLSLAMTNSPDPVNQGATLTYSLTVANAGPYSATGIVLTDTLPAGVSFVSSTPGPPACIHASGTVTCNLANLTPSASTPVTIRVTPSPGTVGTITNSASVTATEFDPVPANNSASATTTVPGPAPVRNLWAAATSTTTVALRWTDPQSSETGFRLERSETGTSWTVISLLGPNVTTSADTGCTPGTLYYYRVVAVSGVGEASASNVAAARTFPATAAKVCVSQVSPMHEWARYPSVAWNGTSWGVVWADRRDGKEEEIYFQRLDAASGTPQGVPVNISNSDMPSRYPTVRWNGSRFGVVWYPHMRGPTGTIPAGTSFALLDANGNVVRSRVRIDDSGMTPGWLNSNLEAALAWNGSEWGFVSLVDAGGASDLIFYRFSAEGDRIGNPVRLTTNPENELDISVAWSGTSYGVSWIRQSGTTFQVLFQRMQVDGTLLGAEAVLWENTGGQGIWGTSTVWDGAGWAVAFADYEATPETPTVVYIRKVNPDGTPNGAAVRVSPAFDPDFPPDQMVPVYDELPVLLVKAGGGYVVFTSSFLNTDLVYEVGRYETDATGNRIGTRTILSDNDGRNSMYARAASDGTKFLTVYNDGRNGTMEAAAVLANASGPALGGPYDVTTGHGPGIVGNVLTSGGQLVLPVGDGFAALWSEPVTFNSNQVWAKIFDGSGGLAATRWPLTTRSIRGRPGGVGVGDTFALAWKDPLNNVVFARYDALGNALITEAIVASGTGGLVPVGVAFSGESYGVFWFQGWSLRFQRVAPDGTLVGARTMISLSNAPAGAPQIVWTGSGWAVVYLWGNDLQYVFLDPSGAVTVGPIPITATPTPEGPFTLCWSGQNLGLAWVENLGVSPPGEDIYFTRLDLNGVKAFDPKIVVGSPNFDGAPSLYWDRDRFRLVHSYGYYSILREIEIFPDGTVPLRERFLSSRGGGNSIAWNGTTLGILWPQVNELYFQTTACLDDVSRPTCPPASISVNAQTATLTWSAATDPDSGIYHYFVYRDGFQLAELRPTTMSFVDGGFPPGVTHPYEVRAQNGAYLESTGCPVVTFCPDAPTATNNGPLCAGGTLQLSASSLPGAAYSWTGPNGFTSPLQNPSIVGATTAASGMYSVTVTVAGCTSAAGTTSVIVNPVPAAPIVSAPAAVCTGSPNRTASVPLHAGSTYAWTIGNGTITGGQGSNQITFTAGTVGTPLTLSVTETSVSGCVSTPGDATVTVTPFGSAVMFYTIPPCRVFDTRNTSGPDAASPALAPGVARIFDTSGRCGIPASAHSLSVNVTVTGPTALGFVTLFPGDGTWPLASTINFMAGQTRANNAVIRLATDGSGQIGVLCGSTGAVDFILDVNGYFQ